jgi:adenosylmethionine-8-amino-7-oxononanoate aminotransferase
VFYASDGSSAIEIALKMSLHARQIQGKANKTLFLSLQNAYHGETSGALAVSDLGLYRAAYDAMLMKSYYLAPLPYVSGKNDPLWHDCSLYWEAIEKQLQPLAENTTAIVVEPIVQGTAGMQIYSQDFLQRLRAWTKAHDIHLIADEVMTGLGRTGTMLACEHAKIEPDFLCLAKGLTSGWLPLSAVMTSDAIYDLFYDDYQTGKSFLHSHTFSGNVLAARVALEVLKIYSEENICEQANQLGDAMLAAMQEVARNTGQLKNVRGIGAIVAADLICEDPKRRLGFEVYQKAVQLGALLRPIGNTIYWLPPLNMEMKTLKELQAITTEAILNVSIA